MSELFELRHIKRSTELYLRALWGKGFSLRLSEQTHKNAGLQSYLVDHNIFLPEQINLKKIKASYYRAAAAHASSHAIYSQSFFKNNNLNLLQRNMIGLIEDLRVELLSSEKFPGLRKLWLQFHKVPDMAVINAMNLMLRLSMSVLDSTYSDSHHWVNKGKRLFYENADKLKHQSFTEKLGLILANDLGQMRLPLNSGRYEQSIAYRDDNRCLWKKNIEHQQQVDSVNVQQQSLVQKNKLTESSQGMQIKIARKRGAGEGFYLRENENSALDYHDVQYSNFKNKNMYPEWDYRSQILKKDWCTLIERKPVSGSKGKVEKIFKEHKRTLTQLRAIAKKLQMQKQQRVRRMAEGDDIDFDPMINAMVSLRTKQMPDTRVFVRYEYRHSKTLAISILLDLSESTNEKVVGSNHSVSEMLRDAVLLLGETLSIADEQFSISGFCSNGRHEINFINFKSFAEDFSDSKERLTDISGQYSTRLGVAIRHAAFHLAQQSARKKLLLIITDGAPSDIDIYDSHYLEHDSRHAVNSLIQTGIKPFCLNLDASSDSVIEHIFGKGRFETLQQLLHLPEVLSRIYMRHGRRP